MHSPLVENRLKQLNTINDISIDGLPLLIHGSVAHETAQGLPLPPARKPTSALRDIDVYTPSPKGKFVTERILKLLDLDTPSPIDAGSCGMLLKTSEGYSVTKSGMTAVLEDSDFFDEVREYEVVDGEGVSIRSFSPMGLLGLHSVDPYRRVTHGKVDSGFTAWCEDNSVKLPQKFVNSVDKFHTAYSKAHTMARAGFTAVDVIGSVLPEVAQKAVRAAIAYAMTPDGLDIK